MTDITSIPSFLRIWIFKLVVILDVYSRFPLTFQVFSKEPTSEDVADLVQAAAGRFGRPKHFVTDRGAQFSGQPFAATLCDLGAAAIRSDRPVRLDRHHRTLVANSEGNARSAVSAAHFPPPSRRQAPCGALLLRTLRPHQGLGGATPAEIYFGLTPAGTSAVSPPRATSARDPAKAVELPLEVVHDDHDRRLPFLIARKLAA